jgi:hypothetical protein
MPAAVDQRLRLHEPLREGDTNKQTVGCRHTSPDICSKNLLVNVCAFARTDGMCMSPPARWSKQYERLLQLRRPTE